MRQTISVDTSGATQAILLNTDDLARLFGKRNAININSMKLYPVAFGTAVDILVFADNDQLPDESAGDATSFPEGQLLISQVDATGAIIQAIEPSYHAIFRFTTADINPQTTFPSVFPVFDTLIVTWNVEVDFIIEFDYTELDVPWNMRFELMDLLKNKRQVEDPNLSNVDGKRSLRRAGLVLVAD